MLKFKVVRWKNFLSTGDDFIEIPLDTDQITLITGRNGAGKCVRGSTEIDISFDDPQTEQMFLKSVKKCKKV